MPGSGTDGVREAAAALDPNEDFDDISLTFWIALWTVLAIVAAFIYVKLKGVSSHSPLPSKRVEEQIARKLVNEISRKENLDKRSTFRRQRSYEIIDGEVRIHYDVPFEESGRQGDNYREPGKDADILASREVESFPSASTEAMDEMELLFPTNLPRIIEEGEELYEEDDIIVKAVHVEEESCPQAQEDISAPEVYDSVSAEKPGSRDKNITARILSCEMARDDVHSTSETNSCALQHAGQTIATEIRNLEQEKDNSYCTDTEAHLLSNHSKLSSDEVYSTSDESAFETTNSVQILRPGCASDNQIMNDEHTSHSTTECVYRLTELEHNAETHDYTVTRRIYTKTTTEKKSSAQEELNGFETVLVCDQNQDSDTCENTTRQDSISRDNGSTAKNSHSSINSKGTVVRYVTSRESVKETLETEGTCIEKKQTSCEGVCEKNADLQEPDVVDEGQTPLGLPEVEECEAIHGSLENGRGFPLHFSQLQDGGDLLVDDSGDILFKVIGPSNDDFLEDIPECGKEPDDNSLDENDNYCEVDPDVEQSKSWKSLPSWEQVHHMQHRELDWDAEDSDVVLVKDVEQADGTPVVKSEEIIVHNTPSENGKPEFVNSTVTADAVSDSPDTVLYSMVGNIPVTDSSTIVAAQSSIENEKLNKTVKENLPAQGKICIKLDGVQPNTSLSHNESMAEDNDNSAYGTSDCNIALDTGSASRGTLDDTGQKSPTKQENCDTACVVHESKVIDVVDKCGESSYVSSTEEIEGNITNKKDMVSYASQNTIPSSPNSTAKSESQDSSLAERKNTYRNNTGIEDCSNNMIGNLNQGMPDGEEGSKSSEAVNSAAPIEILHSTLVEAEDQVSDEEVIVAACAVSDVNQQPEVVLASPINESYKDPFSSQSYCITSSVEVLPPEVSGTKFKLKHTKLPSSPVKVTYVEDKNFKTTLLEQETDVDCVSDVDEINIDDDEPSGESYKKSKSVTDLDEALASYGSIDSQLAAGTMLDDAGSVSKSVPDILDSCLKEDMEESHAKTTDVTSDEILPDIGVQNRHLSVSSPDFAQHPTSEQVKKITKIKIVNVKFLEIQDGSGAEDVEDSFIVEGNRPMSGKLKRRSGNFSPESSPVTSPTAPLPPETGEHLDVPRKTDEMKQLEFGFNELYKDLPPSPQSTSSAGIPENPTDTQAIRNSTDPKVEEMKHVARYGLVQSAEPKYPGMNLSSTFLMGASSNVKKKPGSRTHQDYESRMEKPNTHELNRSSQREGPIKHKVSSGRIPRSKPKSAGRLVTVKTGVINDYYECSSDADSETSYSAPSPRVRAKRMYHTAARDYPDSPSSSEPDSPRMRPSDCRTTLARVPGGDTRMPESALFSKFGVTGREPQRRFSPQLDGNVEPNLPVPDNLSMASNRSVEFNPFANVEGYDGFEPYDRSHSPTSSVSSDQSSVFSFNCDFDPLPPPSSSFNPEVYTCENPMCHRQDILLGPEKTSFKSCPACFTYYCSSECRKLHWPAHKQTCYFGRVNTYVRSIIRLCQRRQDLSMYLSQLARDGYHRKGRGVVMATFSSPELAREFITKGHDAFSGRKPTYSSLNDLSREGIISKHRVALMQAVRDYEPNEEFVFNIAVVAVNDIPISPAPRYKLNTVLHCIKMPLNERIVARRPVEHSKVESRLFALPKCSRHEFVNEMEARRHYCRNLSKNLRQYNIKLKEDYPECYKKLCMYVEHDISFEPMVVYGQRNGLTYKCIVAPEQNYTFDPTYC